MGRVASRPLGSDTMTLKSCTSFTRPSTNSPSLSVWHHKNHANSRCIWWVSDTTTIIQFHTVFDECLTPTTIIQFHTVFWWVSDTTTIIQFHTVFDECLTPQQSYNFTLCLMSVWHHKQSYNFIVFDECLTPQQSYNFTLCLMSVWHHNKHTISHCVWWVSDTTTNIQFHTVFDECLTPQQTYNFTTVFDECLTPQQSYNFTLCLMSV